MKYLYLLCVSMLFLFSCNKTGKALKEQIASSDSVAINFFTGDGKMDTVKAVKIVRDKSTINKLTGFITHSSADWKHKCGYDGSVHYFKQNVVIKDIYFRMAADDCSQFSFMLDGRQCAAVLSEEARALLLSIKNEK